MTDDWVDTGQGQHPWQGTPDVDHLPVHFPLSVVSFIDYAGERWSELESFRVEPGDYGIFITAGQRAGGFHVFKFADERPYFRTLPQEEHATQTARKFRRFPEGILRMALARSETLRWVRDETAGGRRQNVVAFTDPVGAQVFLHFDAATHLLAKSLIERGHVVLGDTTADTLYLDYRRVGGLLTPMLMIDRIAEVPTHKWPIAKTEIDADPPPSAFDRPHDFVPIVDSPPEPTLQPRGDGVFEILGPYNVMFAVFADHVLLVEAPLNEKYTEACLALIASVAPGKPVRAVATHFHYDHVGGSRTLVARGIPIATTADGAVTIRQALAAKHVKSPDLLAKSPRAPQLEIIAGARVFADAGQRVEVYDFGPTPHVAQILVAYFPKTKTLHVADLLDTLNPEVVIPGIDTIAMIEKIKEHRLDVERIVPVHGVPITIDDLNRGLAIRARHVPGTPLDARAGR
jgi:glyoxylase-like metal-dependent hydrolase (beta-lactamase superfamily II)